MPKVQGKDVGKSVANNYIYCEKNGRGCRMHHLVCENNCRKIKKCKNYAVWYKDTYNEDYIKPKKKRKRRKTVKKKVTKKKTNKK